MDDNTKIDIRNEDGVEFVTGIERDTKKTSKKKKGIFAALGAGIAALAKFKIIGKLGFLFAKFKFMFIFLKLAKLFSTFGSMLLMIWVYAELHGWPFAVGFVLLLFIHEMGHYFAAKKANLPVSMPIFIPFVGAAISMKKQPENANVEAFVAIGGPVLGSIGAFLCLGIYYLTGKNIFLALAYSGFILNLFNLIPVHPLDGGRVVTAISPILWVIGIPLMGIAAIKFFNPIIIMLLVLGIIQLFKYYKNPDKKYYEVKKFTRFIYALTYFGLIAILGLLSGYIYHIMPKNF